MTVRSAQSITAMFTTRNLSSGLVNADSLPTGALYVNGTLDAASVTVTNVTTGKYKAAVTLPTLAVGDVVSIVITATVGAYQDAAKIWEDTKDAVVDSAGLVDANTVKVGPTGAGTAQTARDIGLSVLLSAGTGTGQVNLSSGKVPATIAAGDLATDSITAAALKADAVTEIQTGLATSTALTSAQTDITTLLNRLTSARAGYLDNLNVGGNVASHADVLAINTSSSKHIIMQTVGQYERPESGNTVYTVEARTFSAADGSAVNADSTPTFTATGQTSGSLAANLSAVSNPATGVYRATYTVASNATTEPIRFDASAVISAATFTLSAYTQVVDEVSQTWTSTDASHLTAIYNKLPTNGIADETNAAAAALNSASAATQTTSAAIRADLGLGAANLDTQLNSIYTVAGLVQAKTDNLPSDPADESLISAATDAIITAVGTRASQTSVNSIPTSNPSVSDILTGLLVDGGTNKLKVNADHSVNSTGGGSSGNSGAYQITVTVKDDSNNVLSDATITARHNGLVSSVADSDQILNLDAGTYVVYATGVDGYADGQADLVVTADGTCEVVMVRRVITASDPDFTTCYLYVWDEDGVVEGAEVTLEIGRFHRGDTGVGISDTIVTATSDSGGLVQFTNRPRLATYSVRINGSAFEFSGVTLDADTTPLVNALGKVVANAEA